MSGKKSRGIIEFMHSSKQNHSYAISIGVVLLFMKFVLLPFDNFAVRYYCSPILVPRI